MSQPTRLPTWDPRMPVAGAQRSASALARPQYRCGSSGESVAPPRALANRGPCEFALLIPDVTDRWAADWTLESALRLMKPAARGKVEGLVGGPEPFGTLSGPLPALLPPIPKELAYRRLGGAFRRRHLDLLAWLRGLASQKLLGGACATARLGSSGHLRLLSFDVRSGADRPRQRRCARRLRERRP